MLVEFLWSRWMLFVPCQNAACLVVPVNIGTRNFFNGFINKGSDIGIFSGLLMRRPLI